ncbi:LysE family translocator [Neisseria sp. Ec49-e6-T10]|uniref:LysE family translocator n=1 Tax=Neisseria sp. Ec49-e6-T10 TaxID=3140744 RepID=UPI003EB6A86E
MFTDLLSYYFPSTFLTLILAHFVALISPGADFFLIIGNSIRHGLKGSIFICVGIAIANGCYIVLAIFGLSVIKNHPLIFLMMEYLGAAYLLWLGYLLIQSSQKNQQPLQEQSVYLPYPKQFLVGFLSAILNPKNAIFYISLMSSILGNHITLTQQIISGIWLFFTVLIWDCMLALIIGHKKIMTYFTNSIYLIERGSGVILIVIGMGIVYHLF